MERMFGVASLTIPEADHMAQWKSSALDRITFFATRAGFTKACGELDVQVVPHNGARAITAKQLFSDV